LIARLRHALLASLALTALTATSAFAAPPVIDPTPLSNANVGTEYTAFLTATGGEGGPLVFRVIDGKLPAGLKLERSFGVQSALIFGTPTRVGTSTFTVQVEDAAGNTSTETFTITTEPPLPLLVNNPSPTLREGTVGEGYAANLFAIGGVQPYRWAIVGGALPDGLELKGNQISGTPETAGTFAFTARVTDKAGQTAEMTFSITVL
jgi:hypothetical protein